MGHSRGVSKPDSDSAGGSDTERTGSESRPATENKSPRDDTVEEEGAVLQVDQVKDDKKSSDKE